MPPFPPLTAPADRAKAYQEAMNQLLTTIDGTVVHAGLADAEINALALTLFKWRNYREERDKSLAAIQKQNHFVIHGIPDYVMFVGPTSPKPADSHVSTIATLLLT